MHKTLKAFLIFFCLLTSALQASCLSLGPEYVFAEERRYRNNLTFVQGHPAQNVTLAKELKAELKQWTHPDHIPSTIDELDRDLGVIFDLAASLAGTITASADNITTTGCILLRMHLSAAANTHDQIRALIEGPTAPSLLFLSSLIRGRAFRQLHQILDRTISTLPYAPPVVRVWNPTPDPTEILTRDLPDDASRILEWNMGRDFSEKRCLSIHKYLDVVLKTISHINYLRTNIRDDVDTVNGEVIIRHLAWSIDRYQIRLWCGSGNTAKKSVCNFARTAWIVVTEEAGVRTALCSANRCYFVSGGNPPGDSGAPSTKASSKAKSPSSFGAGGGDTTARSPSETSAETSAVSTHKVVGNSKKALPASSSAAATGGSSGGDTAAPAAAAAEAQPSTSGPTSSSSDRKTKRKAHATEPKESQCEEEAIASAVAEAPSEGAVPPRSRALRGEKSKRTEEEAAAEAALPAACAGTSSSSSSTPKTPPAKPLTALADAKAVLGDFQERYITESKPTSAEALQLSMQPFALHIFATWTRAPHLFAERLSLSRLNPPPAPLPATAREILTVHSLSFPFCLSLFLPTWEQGLLLDRITLTRDRYGRALEDCRDSHQYDALLQYAHYKVTTFFGHSEQAALLSLPLQPSTLDVLRSGKKVHSLIVAMATTRDMCRNCHLTMLLRPSSFLTPHLLVPSILGTSAIDMIGMEAIPIQHIVIGVKEHKEHIPRALLSSSTVRVAEDELCSSRDYAFGIRIPDPIALPIDEPLVIIH